MTYWSITPPPHTHTYNFTTFIQQLEIFFPLGFSAGIADISDVYSDSFTHSFTGPSQNMWGP